MFTAQSLNNYYFNIYRFQKIFDQGASQETIFENIAKPVAER